MMKFGVEFTADVGALEEMVAFGVEILIAEGAEKVSGVGPNVEAEASVEVETEEIIFGCLFRSSERGRSRRPCPSLPSRISSILCLLSLSRVGRKSVWRRCATDLLMAS